MHLADARRQPPGALEAVRHVPRQREPQRPAEVRLAGGRPQPVERRRDAGPAPRPKRRHVLRQASGAGQEAVGDHLRRLVRCQPGQRRALEAPQHLVRAGPEPEPVAEQVEEEAGAGRRQLLGRPPRRVPRVGRRHPRVGRVAAPEDLEAALEVAGRGPAHRRAGAQAVDRAGRPGRDEARAGAAEPLPEVPVLDRPEVRVEAAEGERGLAADEAGVDRERAAPRRGAEQVAVQPRPDRIAQPAVGGRVAVAAERAVGARVGLGGRHQRGEVVGVEPVVGVEEQDPAAAGLAQAGVAGGGGAEVGRQGQQPDARVLRRGGRGEGAGAVGGGVVDDDRLEVGQGLGAEAGQGLAERGLGVMRRDDHGDARPFGFESWRHASSGDSGC